MAIPSVNSERANNACKRSVTRLSGHGVAHCVVKEVVDEGKACWWCNQVEISTLREISSHQHGKRTGSCDDTFTLTQQI
jgi:hypothetical protein